MDFIIAVGFGFGVLCALMVLGVEMEWI